MRSPQKPGQGGSPWPARRMRVSATASPVRSRMRSAASAVSPAMQRIARRRAIKKWIKFALALLVLLPLCVASTFASQVTFSAAFSAVLGRSSLPLLAFATGLVLWVAIFLFAPRPMLTYVIGHELTHGFWTWVFGGKVLDFMARPEGGYVRVTKVNFIIALAPYIFPFYTFVLFYGWGLLAIWAWLLGLPLDRFLWILWGLTGLSWGFHLCFTAKLLPTDQPDFQTQGWLFSMALIYLGNIVPLSLLLIVLTPGVTLTDWGISFSLGLQWQAQMLYQGLSLLLRHA